MTELWQLGAVDRAERTGSGGATEGRDAHPDGVEPVDGSIVGGAVTPSVPITA